MNKIQNRTRCGAKNRIDCVQCKGLICDECSNQHDCEKCKGCLCNNCTNWEWESQFTNPIGVMQYPGSVVQFDAQGIGHRYCQTCWNSIRTSK